MGRTNFSTYIAIKAQMIEIFKTEKFEKNRLPSEPVLAKRLGISLVTLREALLMLALEGYITKRHGSGNYVHPSTVGFDNRMFYFYDNFKSQGYTPGTTILSRDIIGATPKLAKEFRVTLGTDILQTRLVYTADANPAVYSYCYIPKSLLVRDDIENMTFGYIHEVIWDFCHREITHSLNEYHPLVAPTETAQQLNLEPNTPIIGAVQTFYDIGDTPILHNIHHFNDNYYTLKTLKNWDLLP